LQSYFDAAQSFQQSGDYAQAALQFQLFIVNALDRLAITRSSIGDYTRLLHSSMRRWRSRLTIATSSLMMLKRHWLQRICHARDHWLRVWYPPIQPTRLLTGL